MSNNTGSFSESMFFKNMGLPFTYYVKFLSESTNGFSHVAVKHSHQSISLDNERKISQDHR